ncbi:MAG: hypothetical protein LBI70_01960 [Rickettsiales bacterium]|jgi:hypothetical protein|nr:hypothetical protein [Rickettsiales bacterium]
MRCSKKTCEEIKIKLFILKSSSPKYHGRVEEDNGTVEEEFWARKNILAGSVEASGHGLGKFVEKYNVSYAVNNLCICQKRYSGILAAQRLLTWKIYMLHYRYLTLNGIFVLTENTG